MACASQSGGGTAAQRDTHERGTRRASETASRQQTTADGARNLKKSGGLLREGERMKFAFIDVEKAHYPVEVLCDVLEVSRSGYYAWKTHPMSARTRARSPKASLRPSKANW